LFTKERRALSKSLNSSIKNKKEENDQRKTIKEGKGTD
jgi:hypothetical protein